MSDYVAELDDITDESDMVPEDVDPNMAEVNIEDDNVEDTLLNLEEPAANNVDLLDTDREEPSLKITLVS